MLTLEEIDELGWYRAFATITNDDELLLFNICKKFKCELQIGDPPIHNADMPICLKRGFNPEKDSDYFPKDLYLLASWMVVYIVVPNLLTLNAICWEFRDEIDKI